MHFGISHYKPSKTRRWIQRAADICLPQYCILCLDRAIRSCPLCAGCAADLKSLANFSHDRWPLPSLDGLKKDPPWDQLLTCYEYEFPINEWISQLKFQDKLGLSNLLGQLMSEPLQTFYESHHKPQVIVPVPLHRRRLRERGYNQALEIARPLVNTLKLPIALNHVQRIKATKPQSGLAAHARAQNLARAFECRKPLPEHIAVIDDVITTGYTMTRLCRTLKQNGVKHIDVWCLARVVCH